MIGFGSGTSGLPAVAGTRNTLIGADSSAADNLTNAGAIGSRSLVTQSNSLVLGSINGLNSAAADTNVGIGTTAPSQRLHVVGNGIISGDLSVGNNLAATAFNSMSNQYLMASNLVLSRSGSNLVAGTGAGHNSTGSNNSFFGTNAGSATTTSGGNSFFGTSAGDTNLTGGNNTLIGFNADVGNPVLNNATAIGARALVTTSGSMVLGSIAGVNGSLSDTNVGIGTTAPTARLHVVGNATFSGTAAASIFNAGTQFNIAGNHVLSTPGSHNVFLGPTTGPLNTGSENTFLGDSAGAMNSTGNRHVFIGYGAGGFSSGGSSNTAIGYGAEVGGAISNATAIGSRASVTQNNSLVLGSINGVNSATADTNVGIGTTAPTQRLHVVGNGLITGTLTVGTLNTSLPPGSPSYIQNGTSQQASSNFNISGTGTANVLSATTQFNIGSNRVLTATGFNNFFAGIDAGDVTTGLSNTFVGKSAGAANGAGSLNSFVGSFAGQLNSIGNGNSMIGNNAGLVNTSGNSNSFFGESSGDANGTGSFNTFIGRIAGHANTTGSNNSALGANAEVGSGALSFATAIGSRAVVSQSNSIVLGAINGVNGATANTNVGIGTTSPTSRLHLHGDAGNFAMTFTNSANTENHRGYRIAFDNDRLTFQRATDFGLFQTNHMAIEQETGNVGIGTVDPTERLHVIGSGLFSGTLTSNSSFNINGSRVLSIAGTDNVFVGVDAGTVANAGENAFLGKGAGIITTGSSNTFIGYGTGTGNGSGSNNTALGSEADVASNNLTFATAIGAGATVPSSNTVQLGRTLDTVSITGKLKLWNLQAAGTTTLCRNAALEIGTCSSSIRYKTNVNTFSGGLRLIDKLRPVSFNWKDGDMLDLGLVAEDVAKVEPLLATTNPKGEVEGVKYDRIGVVLINAVKEQQAQIEEQKKKIDEQQKQIQVLKRAVCELRPDLSVCKR